MCRTQCSGGCEDCAADEHAFEKWWKEYGSAQYDPWYKAPMRIGYCKGWYDSRQRNK